MLKNMEKLLNSLRALCLSTITVSRWVDPQNPRGAGRILVRHGPSHHLPGAGCLPSTRSLPFQQNPSPPTPSGECGCWEGKATLESDGNRRGSDRLEALSSGTVSSVLSAAWPQASVGPTERLKSHSHGLHETSARRLTTLVPLLASEWPQA